MSVLLYVRAVDDSESYDNGLIAATVRASKDSLLSTPRDNSFSVIEVDERDRNTQSAVELPSSIDPIDVGTQSCYIGSRAL